MPLPKSLLAALLLIPSPPQGTQEGHDPRSRPTRIQHALFVIEGVSGPVQTIGDVDGDGQPELLVQVESSLVVHFGGSGATLGVIAEVGLDLRGVGDQHTGPLWQVGPDLDGDGLGDVALFARSGDGLALQILSTRTGDRIRTSTTLKGAPRALAWTSDIDGDGVRDLALVDPSVPFVRAVSGATGKRLWRSRLGVEPFERARLQNVGDRNGDGAADLLLDRGPMDPGRSIWLSGSDGTLIDDPLGEGGLYTALGDLDGDGLGDLAEGGVHGGMGGNRITVHASTGEHAWATGSFPDLLPDWPTLAPIGDVDGDGTVDVAVGDTNFHLPDEREADRIGGETYDLAELTLEGALVIQSQPFTVAQESGCVWVVSGRTGNVLMGVWGEPGTHAGLGARVFEVGDQNGDGLADVGVESGRRMFVFASAAISSDPFDWMPGHWVSATMRDGQVHVVEEVWLDAVAGRMPAISRTYIEGARGGGGFEFLRVERDADGLALFAQPGGKPAVRFGATEIGPGSVVFTNLDHDFPQRIRYFRDGALLRAEVGRIDRPDALALRWQRQVAR